MDTAEDYNAGSEVPDGIFTPRYPRRKTATYIQRVDPIPHLPIPYEKTGLYPCINRVNSEMVTQCGGACTFLM